MKRLALIFTFFISSYAFSQNDSCNLRISLLTCTPGEELYSTFGHTALRVQDLNAGTDFVYNYGTFEFGPDFYTKFIRGNLLYFLSVENFDDFLYQYQVESRSIQEQMLQLDCLEKQKLYAALQLNALEENRYYRYDFLFDNCTTRAGDIVVANTKTPVSFKNILPATTPSFRELIHSYLNAGHQYWSKLGIDMLLGMPVDKKVSNRQAMFLPDYLLKGFDSALLNKQALVQPPRTILKMPSPLQRSSVFTPMVVFILILAVMVILSILPYKWAITATGIFDFLLFFILGLAGLLMVFMWVGTDHKVCQYNFNLAWALPTHVAMAFFVHSHSSWVKTYFRCCCWISMILIITWFLLPQQLNPALLPIVLLITYRSWKVSKNIHERTGDKA